MAILQWDKTGDRLYETGDRNVALFVYNPVATSPANNGYNTNYYNGVAWNGITALTETPSGAEATDLWADDIKYATLRSAEQFGGTIEAYTYPDEWMECDGSIVTKGVTLGQQKRKMFGLAYITTIGNDTDLNDHGEKLHLIYGATASPSQRSYATINDSPEAITFSWEYETNPVDTGNDMYKKVSTIVIDSTKTSPGLYEIFKQRVFGTQSVNAYLPMPNEVLAFFNADSVFTYTLVESAPDDWATTYYKYFTRDGESPNYIYTQVGVQAAAPTFESDTYYEQTLTPST